MKKAFTLAEILIVLVIIGVLTMILLPMAFQSSPDEAVMKFKKGYNTLGTVIRELVSSDEYYQDGDLGIKRNGTLLDGTHQGDVTYFCNTFADIVSTKSVNCSENNSTGSNWIDLGDGTQNYHRETYKKNVDDECKKKASTIGEEIVTTDDIVYYQSAPYPPFGASTYDSMVSQGEDSAQKTDPGKTKRQFATVYDENGFIRIYKIFCMDIDGIGKGEDPFGFAIRTDGKILTGARADEWINKSVQKD